jgi:hypothetical protein
VDVPFIKTGQYFKIYGSDLNDGIYEYPATGLRDEEFNGEVWVLQVPQRIVEIAGEKEAWLKANADVLNSPYASESFGGYSYSKKSSANHSGSAETSGTNYDTVFDKELEQWRKARYEFAIRRNEYVRHTQ